MKYEKKCVRIGVWHCITTIGPVYKTERNVFQNMSSGIGKEDSRQVLQCSTQ